MKIAVLGWGSLVWEECGLRVEDGRWHTDGPRLSIEFARVSRDGRLTLVLYPSYQDDKKVQVYWKRMVPEDIDLAIVNLREREGTTTERIGYIDLLHRAHNVADSNEKLLSGIRQWGAEKGVDAVIWTDLPPRNEEKKDGVAPSDAIAYLRGLVEKGTHEEAKEYIELAPIQIKTKIRGLIEKELGWVCKAPY